MSNQDLFFSFSFLQISYQSGGGGLQTAWIFFNKGPMMLLSEVVSTMIVLPILWKNLVIKCLGATFSPISDIVKGFSLVECPISSREENFGESPSNWTRVFLVLSGECTRHINSGDTNVCNTVENDFQMYPCAKPNYLFFVSI